MAASMKDIKKLIDSGQKKQALRQLKESIQEKPTADAWYLTALAVENEDQQIKALRRAINIDPLHTASNRLLHQLEGTPPIQAEEPAETPDWQLEAALNRDKKVERHQQQRQQSSSGCRRRLGCGCLTSMIMGTIISTIALSLIGVIPGTIGAFIRVTSGVAPVEVIDNVPIEQLADSINRISPVVSKPVRSCHIETVLDCEFQLIDHGYLHEFYFPTTAGRTYAVFLQFFGFSANNLANNMIILDSNNQVATPNCQLAPMPGDYESGIAYVCSAYVGGTWTVRVLGVAGETRGLYVVGVQSVDS